MTTNLMSVCVTLCGQIYEGRIQTDRRSVTDEHTEFTDLSGFLSLRIIQCGNSVEEMEIIK